MRPEQNKKFLTCRLLGGGKVVNLWSEIASSINRFRRARTDVPARLLDGNCFALLMEPVDSLDL
tara:strand:- start:90 stop:281 length:192 start_codon:yes stop_codon:yes gene_type:complete